MDSGCTIPFPGVCDNVREMERRPLWNQGGFPGSDSTPGLPGLWVGRRYGQTQRRGRYEGLSVSGYPGVTTLWEQRVEGVSQR